MRMSLGAALLSVPMVGRAAPLLVGRADVRAGQPPAGQEAAPRVAEPFVVIKLITRWQERGAAVLKQLAPNELANLVARILPKEIDPKVEHSAVVRMSEKKSIAEWQAMVSQMLSGSQDIGHRIH
jgi:hypothetical protein